MKRLTVFITTVILSFSAQAQQDSAKTKKVIFSPLPILISDPFIGFGYGLLANVNFKLKQEAETRYSNAQAYVIKTTNGQFAVQVNHQIFTPGEKWIWQGKLQYLDWPEKTYRLGANAIADTPVKELISYQAIEFEERVLKQLKPFHFIGLHYRLYKCWDIKTDHKPEAQSFFKTSAIGNQEFVASGIGIHYVYDSRDNVQNAFRGKYLEVALNPYLKILGSSNDWTNIRIDARAYHNFSTEKQRVLAGRFLIESADGAPYMIMPQFGRYYTTRGYVQGRYRGNTFVTLETEYRHQIWKWLGAVVFGSLNSISEPITNDFAYLNPAAGGGLRFRINKEQRTNIRVDYGVGINNNNGIYFQVTEMF